MIYLFTNMTFYIIYNGYYHSVEFTYQKLNFYLFLREYNSYFIIHLIKFNLCVGFNLIFISHSFP